MKTLIYRWRLWWICRKLKNKPLKWQKAYALGKLDRFCGHIGGRAMGKTMAVILYGLVRKVKTRELAEKLALRDPDTTRPDGSTYYRRRECFIREYAQMARKVGLEGKHDAHLLKRPDVTGPEGTGGDVAQELRRRTSPGGTGVPPAPSP